MGSRYGGLKQIDPIGPNGEIVMDYSVYDAIKAGFGKLIFIIRRDIEDAFKAVVEPHFKDRIVMDYAFQDLTDLPDGFSVPGERTKPWGTTHAVLACRDIVSEPFGVINADDFYGRVSFEVLAKALRERRSDQVYACLIGFVLRNTLSDYGPVARAICEFDDKGLLTHIVERLKIEKFQDQARFQDGDTWQTIPGDVPVSMNMWGFTPDVFPQFQQQFHAFLNECIEQPKAECLLPSSIAELIETQRYPVEVLCCDSTWFGVTYPEDKECFKQGVQSQIDAGIYPQKLWP